MSTALQVKEDENKQLTALRQIATQSTPPKEIRVRTGRGGTQLKYTDGAYVIRTLNQAFGWDWDFVADSEELLMNGSTPFEVKVRGTLTVRLNGQAVTKTQYGCQPIEMLKNGSAPVSIGDCYKGAATDAMKKCASLLGIALDLYDSDYRADKYADGEAEVEPVRNVKVEDAQPTNTRTQWPKATGIVGQIFAKCQALGWTAGQLANEIEVRFNLSMTDERILDGLAGALTAAQLRELDQALAAEFNKGRK